MADDQHRRVAPPVPNSVVDLMAQRKTLRTKTLNEYVEDVFLKLWENKEFRRYFVPIWRSQTIEGSFIADELCAAMMVRDFPEAHPLVKSANLDSLQHSLRVVANRYGLGRKERQAIVDNVSDDE